MVALPEITPPVPLNPDEGRAIFDRVIVPLDGSTRGERVLQLVVPLAELLGSELTLLHVLLPRHENPGQPGEVNYPDTLHDRTRSLANDYLAEVTQKIVRGRVRTRSVTAAGRTSDMILAHAEHGSYSVIAVGARPRPRIFNWFREGITESVWTRSNVPVLFWTTKEARDSFEPHNVPERIVVLVNGSSRTTRALEYAKRLAVGADLGVTLLGVQAPATARITDPTARLYSDDPMGFLEEQESYLRDSNVDADVVLRSEKAASALLKAEEELPPHLTIMAAGKRRVLSRVVFGSLIARIVRRTTNPIIFIPPTYELDPAPATEAP
jgi:nucleotide-binding universal stress UspA family protein